MKHIAFTLILSLFTFHIYAQNYRVNKTEIREDFDQILDDLEQQYSYFEDKKIDLECIRNYYGQQIDSITTEEETVLFFEYILDECYDSHVILNTNRRSSYRLYSPVYVQNKDGKWIITQVWLSQISNLKTDVLGAEILGINGAGLYDAIEAFPTHCHDKKDSTVSEWIANKVLAGRYNEPRILSLKLRDNRTISLDLDVVRFKKNESLLSSEINDDIGIIRINNSLGNNALIADFDSVLNQLMDTKGLILDLRNTVDGGNSYVARGIMSRFVKEPKPYQMHWKSEQYDNGPELIQSWMEYVSPRGQQYQRAVVVLVGRWTGSMGEGLAIGLEGVERAFVVGTEMQRLAGEMNGFNFKFCPYSYRLSVAKLFHVNGTPREIYVPTYYVPQNTVEQDEVRQEGLRLLLTSED